VILRQSPLWEQEIVGSNPIIPKSPLFGPFLFNFAHIVGQTAQPRISMMEPSSTLKLFLCAEVLTMQ
jgi:hypothetical protein